MNSDPALRVNNGIPRLCYSTKETASALGISTASVYRLIYKKRLKSVPGLRHRLIPISEIRRFIDSIK